VWRQPQARGGGRQRREEPRNFSLEARPATVNTGHTIDSVEPSSRPREHEEDALGRDVDALGRMLGQVLREQEGEGGFALVEEYRAKTKALRADGGWPRDFGAEGQSLLKRTEALSLDEARLVVRAFTAYFHLVNMAEEHHRLRVLRQRERQVEATVGAYKESIAEAVALAAEAKVPAEVLQRRLRGLLVEPVFTAHPTEARRRTVLDCGAWPVSRRRSKTRASPRASARTCRTASARRSPPSG
jgi:phosphoenolpyruvate carboxylase